MRISGKLMQLQAGCDDVPAYSLVVFLETTGPSISILRGEFSGSRSGQPSNDEHCILQNKVDVAAFTPLIDTDLYCVGDALQKEYISVASACAVTRPHPRTILLIAPTMYAPSQSTVVQH